VKLSDFPTSFSDDSVDVADLAENELSFEGKQALERLASKNLSFSFGLTRADAKKIKQFLDELPEQCLAQGVHSKRPD
jgi:hypothetical protein